MIETTVAHPIRCDWCDKDAYGEVRIGRGNLDYDALVYKIGEGTRHSLCVEHYNGVQEDIEKRRSTECLRQK